MTAVGLVVTFAAGLGLVARYLPVSNHGVLVAAAFSPYLMLGAPVSAVLFMLGRHWILASMASGLAIAAVAVELPLYTHETNRRESVSIRVMTANLYLGQADAASVVATAGANADVLAVQELTPRAVERLSAAGLDRAFPYRMLEPRKDASGTGLWSRFSIDESSSSRDYQHAMVSARIRVHGVSADPIVVVAHLPGPWPQPLEDWNRELKHWPDIQRDAAKSAGGGCVITAGDFNSTFDMRPFRNLLRDGYRDAAERSGAGITATFPPAGWLPPLIAIDHVLTYQCTATSVKTVKLPRLRPQRSNLHDRTSPVLRWS